MSQRTFKRWKKKNSSEPVTFSSRGNLATRCATFTAMYKNLKQTLPSSFRRSSISDKKSKFLDEKKNQRPPLRPVQDRMENEDCERRYLPFPGLGPSLSVACTVLPLRKWSFLFSETVQLLLRWNTTERIESKKALRKNRVRAKSPDVLNFLSRQISQD